MQRRMNPVRIFIERRMTLLAEKPVNTGKRGELREILVFLKIQEKEKASKKLVDTEKMRSFQAAPRKRGELPESLVKRKKNPVFLLQHRKKKKNFRKNR